MLYFENFDFEIEISDFEMDDLKYYEIEDKYYFI